VASEIYLTLKSAAASNLVATLFFFIRVSLEFWSWARKSCILVGICILPFWGAAGNLAAFILFWTILWVWLSTGWARSLLLTAILFSVEFDLISSFYGFTEKSNLAEALVKASFWSCIDTLGLTLRLRAVNLFCLAMFLEAIEGVTTPFIGARVNREDWMCS
jgi:hypothetical protein